MASKTKEAETRQKRDPFAYFGGLGELEGAEDDSESDEEEPETDNEKLSFITKTDVDESGRKERLPSADEILDLRVKPKFLNTDAKVKIDWDKYARDDTKEPEEPVNYSSNAIPPPKTYDPVADPVEPPTGAGSGEEDKGNLKRSSTEDFAEGDTKKTKTEDASDSS